MVFQIFGSESSQDYDVMVFVNKIPDIFNATSLCEKNNEELRILFKDQKLPPKKLNSNLAVIDNDIIVKVHKGTVDEVNNSLIDTYSLHHQFFPLQITKRVERDVELKVLRTARVILSFLSRTEHREMIKLALKKDFDFKIETLSNIDISKISDFGQKNLSVIDIYKTIAFQLGQALGLLYGKELYTKEAIVNNYPFLSDYIFRKETDLNIINDFKNHFIHKCTERKIIMQKEPDR